MPDKYASFIEARGLELSKIPPSISQKFVFQGSKALIWSFHFFFGSLWKFDCNLFFPLIVLLLSLGIMFSKNFRCLGFSFLGLVWTSKGCLFWFSRMLFLDSRAFTFVEITFSRFFGQLVLDY